MSPAFDILGFGCVAVDDLLYVASFPQADAKAQVFRRDRQCGGLVGTALVAASRLGARCAYVAPLGGDELSEFALGRLRQEKIDVSHVARKPEAFPVHSMIVVGEDSGSRNVFFDLSGVTASRASRLPAALVRSARVLFIDHLWIEQKLPAVRIARKAGIPVVADFEDIAHPRFPELLALVDHLILSAEIARQLTAARPARAVEKLWSKRRQVVVVTGGAEGCWFRASATAGHVPAFAVKAVDTTGCGDVFHGAYATGLARGLGIEERLRFAAAAAALKATRSGGQQGIPTRPEVGRFLQQYVTHNP
jgi:sugar/nucleoside kinase (ribokinase family)